jgi:hypothetical protein
MSNTLDTSDVGQATEEAMAQIQNKSVSTEIFYHVVLDCDFGEFIDAEKRAVRQAIIFGKVAQNIGDRVPILFDKNEAVNVATKLITMVVARGSTGVGTNKKYPFLGAVIIGCKFDGSQISEESTIVGGSRNYSNMNQLTADLSYYTVDGKTRGTISRDAMSKIRIMNCEYIVRQDLNPDNGFALLNLCGSLTVDDVAHLKCLYNKEGKGCFSKEKTSKLLDVESRGEIVLIGGNINDQLTQNLIASRKKAEYLVNKKKIQLRGGTCGTTNPTNVENAWKQKYLAKKAEYLQMKANKYQMGGGDDDSEKIWKQKYMTKKAEYLSLKNLKKGM